MSVTFDIVGYKWPADEDECCLPPAPMFLQLGNANASDFLSWLGLDSTLWGEIPARELAAILRRRLWPERRHVGDPGILPETSFGARGAVFIHCGREPGKLATCAERLLALAEFADEGTIFWS